jgi:phosphate uptake regulator
MMMVSRALERIGDQVVDIAEQTAFLLTGEMMEFNENGIGGTG